MDPHTWPPKAGRPARTYIQQLCEDTGCCPEDLPRAINDREEWRERVRDIRATSAIWWWWYLYYYYYFYCYYCYHYWHHQIDASESKSAQVSKTLLRVQAETTLPYRIRLQRFLRVPFFVQILVCAYTIS